MHGAAKASPPPFVEDLLTIDEAARTCSVSRDTIKRRLRRGEFPAAVRGQPVGERPPPWLIPLSDLVAAGLRPLCVPAGEAEIDRSDPLALREALARQEALSAAREAHLLDLRTEIRRLHEQLQRMTGVVAGRCASCPAVPTPTDSAPMP